MEVTVETKGLKEIQQKLESMQGDASASMNKIIRWGTFRAAKEVRSNASGRIVKVRSGQTRASIREEFPSKLVGRVAPRPDRQRVVAGLEFGTSRLPGGVLKPRNAKFLTIPTDHAKTAAGVGTRARDWPDLFFMGASSGQPMLMQASDDGKLTPMFILKRQVTQKPKRLFELSQKTVEPLIVQFAHKELERVTNA